MLYTTPFFVFLTFYYFLIRMSGVVLLFFILYIYCSLCDCRTSTLRNLENRPKVHPPDPWTPDVFQLAVPTSILERLPRQYVTYRRQA